MKDKANKSDRDKNFNEKGKFIKGNVIGRMPKKGFNLQHLNKLVLEYEQSPENKKGTLLKHYIKRLYKNDRLLAKFFDKNIPTKLLSELSGPDGGPLSITLKELIYGKEPIKPEKAKKKDIKNPETL